MIMNHDRFVSLYYLEKARREIENGNKDRAIQLLGKTIVLLSENS